MDKLKMQTPDLTDKNIEQIAALFPNVITEIKDENGNLIKAVDFDLLKQALSKNLVEADGERYRLDWPGKKASLLKANTPITKTLRPCREESVNFDTTENLYIEGDNFEVLKILQESYLGKVKMIYIDPPYNTGNDFIYKDDFKQSREAYEEYLGVEDEDGGKLFRNTDSNGRFHSDWLSMMYERLVVARDLLSDDGVIFISIDDNEVHNLRKICDEVFGEENALSCFTIKVRYEGKTLVEDMLFQKVVENIFVYTKSYEKTQIVRQVEDYSYEKFIWEVLEKNAPRITELGGKTVGIFNLGDYEFVKKEANNKLLKEIWATGSILDGNSSGRFFRDYLSGRYRSDGLGVLYKVYGIGNDELPYRYFTGPKREGATKGKYFQGVPKDKLKSSEAKKKKPIITFIDLAADFGNCRHEGDVDFRSGKKPTTLIKQLAAIIPWNKNDIILDFFSGSATTAHAVMQLNTEDGGKRKFIMVQLPEKTDENSEAYKAGYKTIAEIGKERIRRAGKKILPELESKNQQLKLGEEPVDASKIDVGFRVYKTDSTNMKDVFYHPSELKQMALDDVLSNIKEDRTPEDLLTQVILDLGLELSLPIETKKILGNTVFIVQTNALVACFDNDIDFKIVDTIADLKPFKVVFKDASFKDDKDRINVEERFKRLSPETKVTVI
ncbi:MAG: site-specific DNA-methyltransferase [Deltaproteobacteria bacterium]|nr:MAG: site-specific DNA-methyltransferase [Deltaproteobacteria bacterium]